MHLPAPLLRLVVAASALAATGCVATQFQKASPRTPPPIPLNLAAVPSGPLQAQLDTVIVFEGPGSWKRRAFWDEYVVTVTNPSHFPARLLGATLVTRSGRRPAAGGDWKALERESADWFKRNATTENVALGAGTAVVAAGAGAGVLFMFAGALMGGWPVLGLGAATLLVSAGSGYLLEVPSQDAERAIAAEFSRRRIERPHELPPGASVTGSVFFRISPSPQRLLLEYQTGPAVSGRVERFVIALTPLAGLHRKPGTLAPPPSELAATSP